MTTPDLETRAVELREADAEAREVRGVAVPWGELAEIGGVYREQFERGSLVAHASGVKLYDQHMQIVGTAELKDGKRGADVLGKVARTAAGNDFLELVRTGAYGHLSIGFERGGEHRIDEDPDDGGLPIVTRTRAVVREVSGVPFPAYSGASITDVRSAAIAGDKRKGSTMPDAPDSGIAYATAEDLEQLRDDLDNVGRRVDTIDLEPGGGSAPSRFRSAGEFLKALAAGDAEARAELTDVETRDAGAAPATSALAIPDAGGPGWLSRPIRHVLERRRIVNLFGRESLPAEGNTIDWPMVDQAATTGAVEKQATEGSALTYMEVKLKTGTATVGTYGGFSELTRQAIERGNPAYLSAVVQYQAIQYAKATNLAARNAFQAIVPGTTLPISTDAGTLTRADARPADWIAVVFDACAAIEDSSLGLLADYMIVSRDIAREILSLTDSSDRPVFGLPNGGQSVNAMGSGNPVTAAFNIAGLPGFVDPGLPAGTCKVASSEAMTTLESPGAPFRLEDEDIINLSRAFSLYGYAAWTENDAAAVVSITDDTTV